MHYRSLRSLFTTNEATLQSIVEILLDPQRTCVKELRLIADGTKGRGAGRFGFADVFVMDGSGNAVILELKDIHLAGLHSGKQGQWVGKPSYGAMQDMEKEVISMGEDSLNGMAYMYWSKDQRRAVRTTVGQIRKDGMVQLERYMQVVAMGPVKDFSDSGVFDHHVKISNC